MKGLDPGDPEVRDHFKKMSMQQLVVYLSNLEENEETPISFSEFMGCTRFDN